MIRVVVVDDVASVRTLLTRTLPFYDIEVVGDASTGQEAMDIVEATQPDVVVLDVHMPGMSGIDALESIQTLAPRSRIIMFSNDDDSEVVNEALLHGAAGYLTKLTLIPDIAAEIERVFHAPVHIDDSTSRDDPSHRIDQRRGPRRDGI